MWSTSSLGDLMSFICKKTDCKQYNNKIEENIKCLKCTELHFKKENNYEKEDRSKDVQLYLDMMKKASGLP